MNNDKITFIHNFIITVYFITLQYLHNKLGEIVIIHNLTYHVMLLDASCECVRLQNISFYLSIGFVHYQYRLLRQS